MAIYGISDLHLSFSSDKPMSKFGWIDYEEKIAKDWDSRVTPDDLVIIGGDSSWAMKLEEAKKDLEWINSRPGRKIMIKGNHDYWWQTMAKLQEFKKENNLNTIDFLYNNAYEFYNRKNDHYYIICGTRGWNYNNETEEDEKIYKREQQRLEFSLNEGLNLSKNHLHVNDVLIHQYKSDSIGQILNFDNNVDFIVCMHYPPIKKDSTSEFVKIMERGPFYTCLYGHLHGLAHRFAVTGVKGKINYKMISCDYNDFKLLRIV